MTQLLIVHPEYGVGATAGAGSLPGRVRVRFSSGRAFDLPLDDLDVMTAPQIMGRLHKEDRKFVSEISSTWSGALVIKPEPTPGAPGESLPERLARKFLTAVEDRDNVKQLEAYKALCTIAKRACGRKTETDSSLDAEGATSMILADLTAGKNVQMRYFAKLVEQIFADDWRRAKAQKRNCGEKPISLTDRYDIAGSATGDCSLFRGDKVIARSTGVPISMEDRNAGYVATQPRPTTHKPAGREPRRRRK
jgi:hypothetical protein